MMIQSFKGQFKFLSNFYQIPILIDNITFPSVENAFQAYKCESKTDRNQFINISSSDAKRLGRKIKLRHDWDSIKDDIMLKLVRIKFRDSYLKQLLIKTGQQELIEGNYWNDTYWGVCKNVGLNKLGKLLMQVRLEINSFKVIIAGSRTFTNFKFLTTQLDHLLSQQSNITIITGMAKGTDTLAVEYANLRNYPIIKMPADWNKFGKSAGYIRNIEMAKIADACVCFWDSKSKGTEHMISQSQKFKLKLKIVKI